MVFRVVVLWLVLPSWPISTAGNTMCGAQLLIPSDCFWGEYCLRYMKRRIYAPYKQLDSGERRQRREVRAERSGAVSTDVTCSVFGSLVTRAQ